MLYGSLADFSLYTEYLTPSVGNWHVLQLLPRPTKFSAGNLFVPASHLVRFR